MKKEDGTPRFMHHEEAADYCKSIGAKLPSYKDFIRLREYMGAKGTKSGHEEEGYEPQVLPNLKYTEIWSSALRTRFFFDPVRAYVFDGANGYIYFYYRFYPRNGASVRCVVGGR